MIQKYILFFTFFIVLTFNILGQNNLVVFDRIGVEDGLSQGSIKYIYQDTKGFMWICTWEGLNKYDAYSFTHYKHEDFNSNSLTSSLTTSIVEQSPGVFWVGTDQGLNLLNDSTHSIQRFLHDSKNKNTLCQNSINYLTKDKYSNIWIATDNGLDKLNPKTQKFTHYFHVEANNGSVMLQNRIRTILFDSFGKLWLTVDRSGLFCMDTATGVFVNYPFTIQNQKDNDFGILFSIGFDSENKLQIGTYGKGVCTFDTIQKIFESKTLFKEDGIVKFTSNVLNSFLEVNQEENWWATENGLYILNPKTNQYRVLKHNRINQNSISNNYIQSIFLDKWNTIWIGTSGGGINKYQISRQIIKSFWHEETKTNCLTNNYVKSIYEDKTGRLWLGTNDGIDIFNPESSSFEHFSPFNEQFSAKQTESITDMITDHKGNIWIATSGSGVLKMPENILKNKNKKNIIKYSADESDPNSLISNHILAIFQDSKNRIWVGTWFGLDQLVEVSPNEYKFLHYQSGLNEKEVLSQDRIFCITEDSQGDILIGTRDEGLNILTIDSDESFALKDDVWMPINFSVKVYKNDISNPQSLSNNKIRSILEDSQRRIWVGTCGGLNLFDKKNKTFQIYGTKEEIPDNVIYALEEDAKGNIWFSTNRGLVRYTPRTNSFKTYSKSDGLQDNQFAQGSACFTSKGKLVFGGVSGFSIFNPDSLIDNTFRPQVYITSLRIGNSEILPNDSTGLLKSNISYLKEITLSSQYNSFSLVFTALNFTSSYRNEYAYMLEGFDEDWIYSGNQRMASYTNIDPGTYIFRVKASNNDKFWNDVGTILKIKIQPSLTQTWYFKLIVVILFVIIGFIILNLRTKFILKQKDKLEQLVKTRTEELLVSNDDISKQKIEIEKQQREILSKKIELEMSYQQLEMLSLVAKYSHNAVIITDSKGNIEWINDSFERMFGYTYEQLLKDKGKNILGKNTPVYVKECLEKCVNEKTTISYELLTVRKNMASIWIFATVTPILDKNNKVTKLIIVDTDITKLKETELEVLEQKNQVEQSYNELRILSKFSREVSSTLDILDIQNIIFDYLKSLMDVSAFGLGIYVNHLEIIEFNNFIENGVVLSTFSNRLNETNSMTVYCFKNNKPVVIADFENEHKLYITDLPNSRTSMIPFSAIYLPLNTGTKTIGVLTVQSYHKNAYQDKHLAILETLANSISVALDNANAYSLIRVKNNQITESIKYALSIQESILQDKDELKKMVDCFVLFRPKDVISGDFYWYKLLSQPDSEVLDLVVAVVDCTGHGVPGAMMSILGAKLLNDIVNGKKLSSPSAILSELDIDVRRELNQYKTLNDDGMDVSICRLIMTKKDTSATLIFSSARRPLVYFENKKGTVQLIEACRRGIGGKWSHWKDEHFPEYILELQKGDIFYLFSDGYTDQNSPDRNKIGKKNLSKIINKVAHDTMENQLQYFEQFLISHQKTEEQRDDITLIGIKI